MLDVHPPHEPIISWKDFLLHLVTITIGLLIALSLEGWAEWMHHRHLVHEAEASLYSEIQHNADGSKNTAADIEKQQQILKQDVVVFKHFMHPDGKPVKGNIDVTFKVRGYNSLSWETAQSTGALAYMPYDQAKEYAQIYQTQHEIDVAEHQAARDAIVSLGPLLNMGDSDPDPTPEQASAMKDHVETLQGQLVLLDSLVKALDGEYGAFLAAHR